MQLHQVQQPPPELEPKPKRRCRRTKVSQVGETAEAPEAPAAPPAPATKAARPTAKGKPKAKPKAKAAKAKAAASRPRRAAKAKATPTATPSPKAKAKAKAKAQRRARPRADADDALLQHPCRDDAVIKGLMDHTKQYPEELDQPEKGPDFKKAVRATLEEHETCWYNIYWSRSSCGVKCAGYNTDVAHFSFNTLVAPNRWKTAVSVRCAQLAAAYQ